MQQTTKLFSRLMGAALSFSLAAGLLTASSPGQSASTLSPAEVQLVSLELLQPQAGGSGSFNADGDAHENPLNYQVITEPNGSQNGTVRVTTKGTWTGTSWTDRYAGAYEIPVTVTKGDTYYDVVEIGEKAFYMSHAVTSVTFAAGSKITTIKGSAFSTNEGITNMVLPEGVTTIGEKAFSSCGYLKSVSFPASLTTINYSAFLFCGSLTSITFPASVTSIGGKAFQFCRSLTSITFVGAEPPEIGADAFNGVAKINNKTLMFWGPKGAKAAYQAVFNDRGMYRASTASGQADDDPITIVFEFEDEDPKETPSSPSTPYIPPVTVNADTASGSTTGAKLEMKASQLPSGVEASDVTFVAKAVSAPEKLASTTLESIPNLPTAKSITVYDLDLLLKSSGEKVDFTGKVTVSIPMPAGYGSFLRVFHVADDGAMTEVPAVINGSNILLTLEHFSHYAVVDFASPAGKLPAKLTASATVTTAATTAKPSEGGSNAGKNPTTGAMLPLLAILGCVGAGMVAMKVAKKK